MKKATLLFILAALVYTGTNAQSNSPILVRPPNTTILESVTPSLQWCSVSGTASYEVWISTDPNFGFLVNPSGYSITDTFINVPSSWELQPNTLYYWEIKADPGNFSQVFSFTTQGTSLQELSQLSTIVSGLITNYQLPTNQGNILNNRLNHATQQLNLNHSFAAIVQMLIFKLRVFIIQNSNLINPPSVGDDLQNYADNVIGKISNGNFVIPPVSVLSNAHTFTITQNYPNPFNPTTNIEYSIPERTMVTLKIYDILGREVATLVNKEQDAGTYISVWNANNFSSGIYFYRLTAANYVQTKRMVLNK